jgi:hypothetical protein
MSRHLKIAHWSSFGRLVPKQFLEELGYLAEDQFVLSQECHAQSRFVASGKSKEWEDGSSLHEGAVIVFNVSKTSLNHCASLHVKLSIFPKWLTALHILSFLLYVFQTVVCFCRSNTLNNSLIPGGCAKLDAMWYWARNTKKQANAIFRRAIDQEEGQGASDAKTNPVP